MLLHSIHQLSQQKPFGIVKKFILSNRETVINEEEFVNYFFEVKPIEIPDDDAYSISGSGGSGIAKPNLSSITCLYIASLNKVRVAKVGSPAITSRFGSTDFFKELGINMRNQKKKYLDHSFAYYDIYQIWPWVKLLPSLLCNPYFFELWAKYEVYPIQYHNKLTGILGWSMVEAKRNKRNWILRPTYLSRFWTEIGNQVIDEFCVGENYIENQKIWVKNQRNLELTTIQSRKECKKINHQLLMGNCTNLFWSESLKRSFCLSSLHFKLFTCYEEAEEMYSKILKDQLVKKLIQQLQDLS